MPHIFSLHKSAKSVSNSLLAVSICIVCNGLDPSHKWPWGGGGSCKVTKITSDIHAQSSCQSMWGIPLTIHMPCKWEPLRVSFYSFIMSLLYQEILLFSSPHLLGDSPSLWPSRHWYLWYEGGYVFEILVEPLPVILMACIQVPQYFELVIYGYSIPSWSMTDMDNSMATFWNWKFYIQTSCIQCQTHDAKHMNCTLLIWPMQWIDWMELKFCYMGVLINIHLSMYIMNGLNTV